MKRPFVQEGKLLALMLSVLACFGLNLRAITYSGLYGHAVEGYAQAVGPISDLQNSSNLNPPNALVSDGPELWADFSDVFGTPWHLTVDFQDNYQIVFQTTSSNPSANISGGTVGWHLNGFDFTISDFQSVSLPANIPSPVVSFDQSSIYVGFPVMAAYAPYNSYTFQVVPIPEPQALPLAWLGIWLMVSLRRRPALPLRFRGTV